METLKPAKAIEVAAAVVEVAEHHCLLSESLESIVQVTTE